MVSFHTLLHPTDFSPAARRAFELACSLARSLGSRVIVTHVLSDRLDEVKPLHEFEPIGPCPRPIVPNGYAPAQPWLTPVRELYFHPALASAHHSPAPGDCGSIQRQLEALLDLDRYRNIETVLRVGNPAQAILALADEVAADMIVMGTHGRTGLKRLMIGSVAETVLRQSNCPVLTVH